MKRAYFITGILLSCALICAGNARGAEPQVSRESYTDQFTSYKTEVEMKASPAQVQEYFLTTGGLFGNTGRAVFKKLSDNRVEKTGDSMEYGTVILGYPARLRFILIYFDPGRELWFVTQKKAKENGPTSIYKLKLENLGATTRVSVSWEQFVQQNQSKFARDFAGAIDFSGIVTESIENGLAAAQVHFDPSLQVRELLAKGARGEFGEVFYSGHRVSIPINAEPSKVMALLGTPEVEQAWSNSRENVFAPCWADDASAPCGIRIGPAALGLQGQSFITARESQKYLSAYWVFPQQKFMVWVRVFIEPDGKSSRLVLDSAVYPTPGLIVNGLAGFLIDSQGLPGIFDNILSDAKQRLEKS